MNKTNKWTIAAASALVLMLGASSSLADNVVFGSDDDGYGGFTTSAPEDAGVTWTLNANSVTYANAGTVSTGTKNSSFLGEFTLDRSVGSSYIMTGTLTWDDGNPDQNCRLGMYMFGDTPVVPNEDELGAMGIIYNSDDGGIGNDSNDDDDFNLYIGIDQSALDSVQRTQTLVPVASDLHGTQFSFSTAIDFVDVAGTETINITSTMTAGGEDTVVSTSVAAADYTGDYFGFVNRARDSVSRPWTVSYEDFDIQVVPEPATFGLVAVMGGAMIFIRRRFKR